MSRNWDKLKTRDYDAVSRYLADFESRKSNPFEGIRSGVPVLSRFELAAAELRALGIVLARLPGEYRVNYRNGGDGTARLAEDLEQAVELGRALAAGAPATPVRKGRQRRPLRMTPKARPPPDDPPAQPAYARPDAAKAARGFLRPRQIEGGRPAWPQALAHIRTGEARAAADRRR